MRLVLVVSDCPPVSGGEAPLDAPPLPALSALLRAARREPLAGDWRSELTRRYAPRELRTLAPAAVACAALPQLQARDACFATPVHLLATPVHLRLPADGMLWLSDEEGEALCVDFARVFEGAGLSLHFLCGRFVLTGLSGGEGNADPALLLGSRLAAGSQVAPAWRRLGSEIELWLHAHAVNEARARVGRAAVNALWLWGGGPTPATWPPRTAPAALFHGDDAFIAGLAALGGESMRPVGELPRAVADAPDQVVQLSLSPPGRARRTLAALDAEVFGPLLERLRARDLASIEVLIEGMSARLTRHGLARFWRRRRPWWEYLRR